MRIVVVPSLRFVCCVRNFRLFAVAQNCLLTARALSLQQVVREFDYWPVVRRGETVRVRQRLHAQHASAEVLQQAL